MNPTVAEGVTRRGAGSTKYARERVDRSQAVSRSVARGRSWAARTRGCRSAILDVALRYVPQHDLRHPVFERADRPMSFNPLRLEAIQNVYAMTIHKRQGSEFETAAVLLAGPESRIFSCELLYTSITGAEERLIVLGNEQTIRPAVERPVAGATGLRTRLWNKPTKPDPGSARG